MKNSSQYVRPVQHVKGREILDFIRDSRFAEIERFQNRVWLSSPSMHGEEQKWVDEAIQTNWVSTVGTNINEVEKQVINFLSDSPFDLTRYRSQYLHLNI